MATIIGTLGDDPLLDLFGTSGSDVIAGLAGNDTLSGNLNADYLFGGDGDDRFLYNDGADVGAAAIGFDYVEGGAGMDAIVTSASIDLRRVFVGSIEIVEFVDNAQTSFRQVEATGSQFSALGLSQTLTLRGATDADVFAIYLNGQTLFDISGFQFQSWTSAVHLVGGDFVRVIGRAIDEKIIGSTRNDEILGLVGNDRLYGNLGDDILAGGDGDDVLYGGAGRDQLSLGIGKDIVVFDSTPNSATNVDVISDFSVADDTIWMKKAIFTGLGALGTLTANQFKTIGVPGGVVDADDRVIYDRGTGFLYYDANGSTAGGAAKIAEMTAGLIMTNADFYVFA
jgi:Ca2+-binding RTX toxin-like protein